MTQRAQARAGELQIGNFVAGRGFVRQIREHSDRVHIRFSTGRSYWMPKDGWVTVIEGLSEQ